MSDMHATLKSFGAQQWGGGGSAIHIDDNDQRLCDACRRGDYEAAEAALSAGANPSVQFRLALGEITPIFLCASKGYLPIADLLIQRGADINRKMDFDGTVCLHHAASNGQFEICEFLIEKGCGVNSRDKLGRTPLMDAAEIGNSAVIQVLVDNKADVNSEDKERHTALSYCIDFINNKEKKFFDAAMLLVKSGANPNYSGKFANRTILHCAAAQGDMASVKQLLGIPIDQEKEEKVKVEKDRVGIAETSDYNYNNGNKGRKYVPASINVYDNDDKTPIDYARENGYDEVADFLQQTLDHGNSTCCTIL